MSFHVAGPVLLAGEGKFSTAQFRRYITIPLCSPSHLFLYPPSGPPFDGGPTCIHSSTLRLPLPQKRSPSVRASWYDQFSDSPDALSSSRLERMVVPLPGSCPQTRRRR